MIEDLNKIELIGFILDRTTGITREFLHDFSEEQLRKYYSALLEVEEKKEVSQSDRK